jgi:signal transduction histidine kinase
VYEARIPLHRRLFPSILAMALVVLAAMSVWRSIALRREMYSQVVSQLEAQVQDRVASWEDGILDQLNQWQDVAAADPRDAWLTEVQLRQREPWFDSVYLWVPRRELPIDGRLVTLPAEFLFPALPPSEDDQQVRSAACLSRARLMTTPTDADVVRVAQAYVNGCRREDLPVRLHAATEAAWLLHNEGQSEDALLAIDSSGLDVDTTLRAAIQQGLDPNRFVVARCVRAQVLMSLGRTEESLDSLYRTGLEIAALDAPETLEVLQYMRRPIIEKLAAHGHEAEANHMELALSQVERRVRAWREIGERIFPRPAPQATEGARFIYDQYSDTPFLLFYGPVRNGEMGAALQLDQPLLVADFLSTMRRFREHLVITDASGGWVAGERIGGEVVVEVAFPRTLSHLRVGLRQAALDSRLAQLDEQWIVPIVIVIVCVGLGFVALLAQSQASRQLQRLLVRQREFTARVTHELKTPLAGIRVMAENLESGAYQNERQQREMARSIVEEADKLALRVDEILSVGRERTVPSPEPFDPEEAILEAIDRWGPRLEQAGVRLHADLHATAQVKGDAAALRDAVGCLLDNALKYRRDERDDAQVWLTLQQDGGDIVVDVVDNGIGVPADMRQHIFERFVRVEGPNRGLSGGHGLGLAQVQETARAHGGDVTCTEGVDGGARFILRLAAIP